MKSTTSLRPATPPPPALLLRYFAAPFTPSTAPLNSPGANGLSTSAITAMWISVAVTPISVALGARSTRLRRRRDRTDRRRARSRTRRPPGTRSLRTCCLPLRPARRRALGYCIHPADADGSRRDAAMMGAWLIDPGPPRPARARAPGPVPAPRSARRGRRVRRPGPHVGPTPPRPRRRARPPRRARRRRHRRAGRRGGAVVCAERAVRAPGRARRPRPDRAGALRPRVRRVGTGVRRNNPRSSTAPARLLHDVFGAAGRHSRSAVGVAALPRGGAVEIEVEVALRV